MMFPVLVYPSAHGFRGTTRLMNWLRIHNGTLALLWRLDWTAELASVRVSVSVVSQLREEMSTPAVCCGYQGELLPCATYIPSRPHLFNMPSLLTCQSMTIFVKELVLERLGIRDAIVCYGLLIHAR
jgi:hypothetical protein